MNHLWIAAIGVAMAGVLCSAGGCSPPGENLVTAGKVVVEAQSVGRVRIFTADVFQDGDTLVVDVSLRRPDHHGPQTMGHMDVAVLGPDGAMLAQKYVHDTWSRRSERTFIWARLLLVAPKGSTVRVLFHESKAGCVTRHTQKEWEVLWEISPMAGFDDQLHGELGYTATGHKDHFRDRQTMLLAKHM